MRIAGFRVSVVEIPFQVSVDHAKAKRTIAQNAVVAALGADGETGWGECCPRSYVSGETPETVVASLRKRWLPELLNTDFEDFGGVVQRLGTLASAMRRNEQAAFCAAELAVLDLAGRHFERSAGEALGPVGHERVRYSGVIAASSEESVKRYAQFYRKLGFAEVKVKVGPAIDQNLRFLEIAREILGPDVELRIDANCAWDAAHALLELEAMKPFGLAGIEQPVPAEDFEGMRSITEAALTPVVADESLVDLDDARKLINGRACDIFNIRVSKCGGLINSQRIGALAEQAGLRCQLGAQVGETGLLSAAGRHYATRCGTMRWCEGSYDSMLLESALTTPDITIGPAGSAPALTAPGIGVSVMEDAIDRFAIERVTLD